MLWTTDVMERSCAVARGIDINIGFCDPFVPLTSSEKAEIIPGKNSNASIPELCAVCFTNFLGLTGHALFSFPAWCVS